MVGKALFDETHCGFQNVGQVTAGPFSPRAQMLPTDLLGKQGSLLDMVRNKV